MTTETDADADELPHPGDIKELVREVTADTVGAEATRMELALSLVTVLDAEVPEKAAFDYFALRVLGVPRDEWLRVRSASRQAVDANVDRAEDRLPDAALDATPLTPSPMEVDSAVEYVSRSDNRLRIVRALDLDGPMAAVDLVDLLDTEHGTVSQNLRGMAERNIVYPLHEHEQVRRPYGLTILGEMVSQLAD